MDVCGTSATCHWRGVTGPALRQDGGPCPGRARQGSACQASAKAALL